MKRPRWIYILEVRQRHALTGRWCGWNQWERHVSIREAKARVTSVLRGHEGYRQSRLAGYQFQYVAELARPRGATGAP